jgi:predicted ATPase/DNA-binding CsgD family transcriptional regulator
VESRVPIDAGVSEREAEVLALVGEHLTNAEIAARLHISVRTVESHVSSLLRKLDAADRRALAALAPAPAPAPAPDRASSVDPAPAPDRASSVDPAGRPGNGGSASASASASMPEPMSALPVRLTSFVGRSAERQALAAALQEHRLVSAVGPGGVGKTRLALAVAADVTDRYAQGAWYVDLVPVTDPAMIGAAIADVLGFGEQSRRSPTDTVLVRLADAEALLVLDNCEHLVASVGELVERLLTACPRVTVLVTSQARLGVPFEWAFAVPGLSLVDDAAGDAVTLFLDRAAMVGWTPRSDDDRRRVAAVCDALDGSALAIELAAARLAARGLDGLEAALGDRLRLLTGGTRLDERHQSVRSALDWSYGLLTPTDQAVLRQVSVFAAPFTSEAAVATLVDPAPVDPGEVAESLAQLAEQSLLVVMATAGPTRYRMLETIRQYGAGRLEEVGEDGPLHDRHLRWCLATATSLADAAAAAISAAGTAEPGAAFEGGFASSADELRAALAWATSVADHRAGAHQLAVGLAELTHVRGLAEESQRRYEQAAELAPDDVAAARLLRAGADVALARLEGDDALRLFRAAADAELRRGDRQAAALDLARAAEVLDRAPGLLAAPPDMTLAADLLDEAERLAGDDPHVEAAILTVEAGQSSCRPGLDPRRDRVADAEKALAVARQVRDVRLESAALDQLSVQRLIRGELRAAATDSIRRTELLAPRRQRQPELAYEYSDALHMASLTCIATGDLAAALGYGQQRYDLPFHREETHLGVNWLLVGHALAGDLDRVVALGDRFMTGWERAGRPPLGGFAVSADASAMVEGLRGDDDARREWKSVAVAMRRNKPADHLTAYADVFDAIVSLHRGLPREAMATLAGDPESLDEWHTAAWRQWYAALWAEAAVLDPESSDGERDGRLDRARAIVAGNPVAGAMVARAEALAAGALDRLPPLADTLAPLFRYQQARTLVLAGGAARTEGERLLAAMHAAPMA